MRVKREQLLHKLQQVSAGLASRELLEQSGCFIFESGKIFTFNDEIFCQVDYDCGIRGAVHASQLLRVLNKRSDEEIEITCEENSFIIAGKGRKSSVAMNAEVLLDSSAVDDPAAWNELHSDFGDALEVTQGSASKDDLHFNMTCLHITPDFVEACDGFQVTRYTVSTGFVGECMIKKESADRIIGHEFKLVSETDNWVHFKKDGLQMSCRRWLVEYPDMDPMLNVQEGRKATLPGGLAEAIETAEIFSSDSSTENQVLIEIKDGKMRLRGEGPHGWHEERKKINYKGPMLSFFIAPRLMVEITKRTNDCEITDNRLKIDAGKFVFVACLAPKEEQQ